MMKFLLYFIVFSCCISCKNTHKPQTLSNEAIDSLLLDKFTNGYPAEIKRLGLQKYFDETKWRMYCILCDKQLELVDDSILKDSVITYGMLPIRFDNANKSRVNADIYCTFCLSTQREIPTRGFDSDGSIYGIIYNRLQDTIISYDDGFSLMNVYCPKSSESICKGNRYVHPLQPEVIKYIRENERKIHP